jgi:hypothetical protein
MSELLRRLARPTSRRRGRLIRPSALAASLVIATCLLASSSSGASATLSDSISGRSYAQSLFSRVPLPSGVTRLSAPIKPVRQITGNPGFANLVDVVRYYRSPSSINVTAFAQSHFAKSAWEGSGSSVDGGLQISASVSALSLCTNRHVAYCGVTYTERALSGGEELRVDVAVVWTPIHVVLLPTSGVVTLTGYGRLSLANSPGDPTRIDLNASQVTRLRNAIAVLRSSPGGQCMEYSSLYTISIASTANAKPFWIATADECPGELTIKYDGRQVSLNARSCPLESLINSFFPPHTAAGTRLELKVCQTSA